MRFMRAACAVSALLAVGLTARADDAAVKKALEAKYNAFGKAFAAKDPAAIEKMAAPGFTTKTLDGKTMNAKESLAMLKTQMQSIPPGATLTAKVNKLTVKGDKAIAESAMTMTMMIPGQGADKKTHKMVATGTSLDTWVKVGGDWKVLKTEDKAQSATMDGQPVGGPGSAAGGAPGGAHKK